MKKHLLILPFILLCVSPSMKESPNESIIQGNQDRIFYLTAPDENGITNYEDTYLEDRIQNDEKNESNSSFSNPKRRPPSNGDTSDLFVPNKNFMNNYYSHLRKNIPYNELGICGYTAISMFLSYFDTYWNDEIIEEKYEQHENMDSSLFYSPSSKIDDYESPDVYNNISGADYSINEIINKIKASGITDTNSKEYKEALDRLIMKEITKQIDADTFLGKLYEIALENGSIKPHFDIDGYTVINSEYLEGVGVNHEIVNNILCDYVRKNIFLDKAVTVTSSQIRSGWFIDYNREKARIRSEIVNLVESGKPVLMGGGGYTDSNNNGKQDDTEARWGHVVVAYDYDSTNDILYGNIGWSDELTHENLDSFFNIEISDYWSFGFNPELPQDYTDHYYFYDKKANYSPNNDVIFNTLLPGEYEFPESYGQDSSIESYIYIPSSERSRKIMFNRLRTGFIEQECINLSPRKTGAGLAYLEYTFDDYIKGINVNLSFWSSKEFTNAGNSEYRIEYYVNGYWLTAKDLWKDVTLSTDRSNPTNVDTYFTALTKKIRFYSTSVFTSDRNKGRLSIFDMKIFFA